MRVKRKTFIIVLIFSFILGCTKKVPISNKFNVPIKDYGIKKDLSVDEFDSYKKNRKQQVRLINEMDQASRWKFLIKLMPGLFVFKAPSTNLYFTPKGKIVIIPGPPTRIGFGGAWKIDNVRLIIELSEEGYKKYKYDIGYKKVEITDYYFSLESIKDRFRENIFFDINFLYKDMYLKVENYEPGDVVSFEYYGHGYQDSAMVENLMKAFCQQNDCE